MPCGLHQILRNFTEVEDRVGQFMTSVFVVIPPEPVLSKLIVKSFVTEILQC